MYKRKLIQKLQQLIDKLPNPIRRQEAMDDLIDLKLSESDYHYISLKDKYKDKC
jgi:predicted metalloenzyme YecM